MFKLYKIIFFSDADSKKYVIYCNKNNLPKVLEQIIEEFGGDFIFFLPLVFTFEIFKKCFTNYTDFYLS